MTRVSHSSNVTALQRRFRILVREYHWSKTIAPKGRFNFATCVNHKSNSIAPWTAGGDVPQTASITG